MAANSHRCVCFLFRELLASCVGVCYMYARRFLELTINPFQRMEPNKNEGWIWTRWEELERMASNPETTKQLFVPLYNLVTEYPDVGREIKSQAL